MYEIFAKFRADNSDSECEDSEDEEDEPPPAYVNISGPCVLDLEKTDEQVEKKINLRRVNKDRKEKGLEYVRKDGTVVPKRHIKEACNCRLRCSEKFGEEVRAKLLKYFLQLKLSGQNQFLANHITVVKTARPMVINSRRTFSRIYNLPGVTGPVKVCKVMFLSTFDIGDRKVRNLAAKKITGEGISSDDQRQQNTSRIKISDEHIDFIKRHILSFPACSSHYTREKSDKKFLSADLNVARMHALYQEQCKQENLIPVHYATYRKIFKTFNLGFRKPKADTCGVCDQLHIKLKLAVDDTEKANIMKELEAHQAAAKRVYDEKRADIALAKADPSVITSSVDLEKLLPTPFLRCGLAFFCRQLYTINFTIFRTHQGRNTATCCLWDETVARRGSQEIGSCLLRDLNSMPSSVRKVIYYSDRCRGQNHNKYIVFVFCYFVELCVAKGIPFEIIHKLMLTGHSHMEVDTVHAAIERAKKRMTVDVEIPHDWAIFIGAIQRSVPFDVVEMAQNEFLATKDLDSRYEMPKKTIDGEDFRFKDIMCFKFSTDHPGMVQFKYDVGDAEYQTIQVRREGCGDVAEVQLKPTETEPIPLSTAKLQDLKKLLPFIKQTAYYNAFLKNLSAPKRGRKAVCNARDDIDADLSDEE